MTDRKPWHGVFTATALPFHDDVFDAVVMLEVYEHLPDPRSALNEIRRTLDNWHATHPDATFLEMEDAVEAQLHDAVGPQLEDGQLLGGVQVRRGGDQQRPFALAHGVAHHLDLPQVEAMPRPIGFLLHGLRPAWAGRDRRRAAAPADRDAAARS